MPFLLLDTPLRGKDDLFAIDDADETLLPTMTDNPFGIFKFKRAIGVRLG